MPDIMCIWYMYDVNTIMIAWCIFNVHMHYSFKCIKLHKKKSFIFKDFTTWGISLICYLSSKRKKNFKEKCFSFYVSKRPLCPRREKPYSRRWSRLTSGLTDQTFSNVWMYGWVAPIYLLTSALRWKRHRAQNEFKAFEL